MYNNSYKPEKLLTILSHGRNDSYCGNITWRMSTAFNKHARNFHVLGVEDDVEILVTDWGSEGEPLHKVLELSEEACRLVKFLIVPPHIAAIYNKDSPYSSVHPVNALARRAEGKYLLLADSDCYIPFESMGNLIYCLRKGYVDEYSLEDTFFWCSRYHIPYSFIKYNPAMREIDEHIDKYWMFYDHEMVNKRVFCGKAVSLMMSRKMWFEAKGIDETYIYWGASDIDFHMRLVKKYKWEDLEEHRIKMFHLEHYVSRTLHDKEKPRKMCTLKSSNIFAPNPDNWGLADHNFTFVDALGMPLNPENGSSFYNTFFSFNKEKLQTVREINLTPSPYAGLEQRIPFRMYHTGNDYSLLEKLIIDIKPESICQIGLWFSHDACFFASFLFVAKIFCVNHWDKDRTAKWKERFPKDFINRSYEQFLANCIHENIGHKIYPLRLDSPEASAYCLHKGLKFDLIYLEAERDFYSVKSDIAGWYPLLSPGGFICGNNWHYEIDKPHDFARGVMDMAEEKNCQVFYKDDFWILIPGNLAHSEVLPSMIDMINGVQVEIIKEKYNKRNKFLKILSELKAKVLRLINLHKVGFTVRIKRWKMEWTSLFDKLFGHKLFVYFALRNLYQFFKSMF